MQTQLLLPNRFKKAGWILLVAGIIAAIIIEGFHYTPHWLTMKVPTVLNDTTPGGFTGIIENDISDELIATLVILGALLVAFSREKTEDEGIAMLRLSSLMWAVLVNYVILLLAVLLVYGFPFLSVLIYNLFTVLIIFIARFHFMLYRKPLNQPV
ncbi:hypothetical protein BH11BAC4_BH11BAC4_18700 [soil metagenome]